MNNLIHIIAEAGTNNNGNLEKAKNLVNIAKYSGANSVKFQIINTWGLYLPGIYEYGNYKIEEVIKIRKKGEMTNDEYTDLAEYAKKTGIEFSASVFDEKGLKLLSSLKPPYIKIASTDLNNTRFLRQVANYSIKTVLSTGMSTLHDIENAVNVMFKAGQEDIILLHCVSVYPARLSQSNLSFIKVLKEKFNLEVGFSDHTQSSIASCMALNFGATWFEKHFTEDKNQIGLDHKYALEKYELKQYVDDLHEAVDAITLKDEKISDSEYMTRKRARRSLYASRKMYKGEIIKDEDILCVRPENLMQANEIDLVVGSILKNEINKYQPFSKEMLQ